MYDHFYIYIVVSSLLIMAVNGVITFCVVFALNAFLNWFDSKRDDKNE